MRNLPPSVSLPRQRIPQRILAADASLIDVPVPLEHEVVGNKIHEAKYSERSDGELDSPKVVGFEQQQIVYGRRGGHLQALHLADSRASLVRPRRASIGDVQLDQPAPSQLDGKLFRGAAGECLWFA